ncbi:hypothetical protein P689_122263 [Candidatus Riesia pediculischaeffi PTSU]|uniref:Uncharacterized protein n=1 Tax=Candidatus Riesia pediculischaeffi PTSU TaxID=1401651 RepID=A0A0C1S973_9ENTR|nr:hypothetical protein P689_122263 [Candidatus Riesia pediculischaeffi PTSU]
MIFNIIARSSKKKSIATDVFLECNKVFIVGMSGIGRF